MAKNCPIKATVKVIKSIETRSFEISLVQLEHGGFCVMYAKDDKTHMSEAVNDYKMAAFMFDLKLQELEGH